MIQTLALYAALALVLATTLGLFVSAKREMRTLSVRERRRVDALIGAMSPVSVVMRSGLNMTTRVQALRMLRRGQDARHIAITLGVPGCEIDLLFRVQTLAARGKSCPLRKGFL